jgi:hypothetical protein
MKQVFLVHGRGVAVVDDKDYERVLAAGPWYFKPQKSLSSVRQYAIRIIVVGGKKTTQALHRFLMGVTDPKVEVDHDDHDGLNNCKYNLRVCPEPHANDANRLKTWGRSKFKGVVWDANKWQAQITVNQVRYRLGRFVVEEDAARAYDKAALEKFGEFALTNAAMNLF